MGFDVRPSREPQAKQDSVRVPDREWDPKASLQRLMLESQLDAGDAVAAATRLLREHAVMAAQSIAHLSAYGESERVRLQASTWIIDRVLMSELDHDLQLKRDQVRVVGQALTSAIRALGLRYGFEHDSEEARQIAQEALLELAARSSAYDAQGTTIDAQVAPERPLPLQPDAGPCP